MIPKVDDYKKIVGKEAIEKIKRSSKPLKGKHIVHVNATSTGGGVAEILNTLVFLMNDLGIDTGWRILLGSRSFFKITKGIHNSLQGKRWEMNSHRQRIYHDWCQKNVIINHIKDHDFVVIHDPQPLGMIEGYTKRVNWIWRCHIDLSFPYKSAMTFFRSFIKKYDAIVVSSKKFKIKRLNKPQYVIHPSIDPLSRKNMNLTHKRAKNYLTRKGIDVDKPLITQISRFDPWKDFFGVIKIYKRIKKKHKCQLILMGSMAEDDPEGPLIYTKVQKACEKISDVKIITEQNDLLVNALQKESEFVFQNSIKEGFALTVSEALWKKTPVLGTPTGGIPLQIIDGKTGFLIRSQEEGIKRALQILKNRDLRDKLGQAGHEHVKNNFLIIRHIQDYLDLFNKF